MILNKSTCLIFLSLLSLVQSSTTASSPDLLLVVLLFLQHLTSLSLVLLNTELQRSSQLQSSYSSQTILSLELLDIIKRVVDQSKTGRTTTSYLSEPHRNLSPKAIWNPKRIMHLSSATWYFLERMLLSSSLDTEARLG